MCRILASALIWSNIAYTKFYGVPQHPYAIVVCCSDSRMIPERIFSVDIGELFVIRDVLDKTIPAAVEGSMDSTASGVTKHNNLLTAQM